MKKKPLFLMILSTLFITQIFAQDLVKEEIKPEKRGQNVLLNEIYAGYAAGSIFYFTGRMKHSDDYNSRFTYIDGQHYYTQTFTNPSSFGTLFAGYSRSLNRVVSMGFLFGFQNFTYTGKLTGSGTSDVHKVENNDILLTGIARFLFSYVNKPVIRMYSGIGIGITIDFGKETLDGGSDEFSEKKLWPGGQLTLMGIRFGRDFGGFFEFGFGSYGIINAGVSYKFAD